jgi:hypothetical protein
MADSSEIDAALLAKLGADATLLSYMPNGVYMDEAPPGSTKFVIVSLVDESDEAVFGKRGYEDALYLVKAVARADPSAAAPNMKSAAARIDALLEDATLTATGYTHMVMHRESRVRMTEVDELDQSVRWYHRGGNYRVQMAVS